MMSETTRRSVLAGAAGVGAVAVLAACGTADNGSGSGDGVNDNAGDSGAQATPTAGPKSQAPNDAGGNTGGNTGGNVLAKTTDIPVGGGKIIDAEKVVVTQPAKGTFKCFSAICTHAGCTVSSVSNGVISCPCHGSRFSAVDGSVKGGPAPAPLAAKKVTVQGDSIQLA
jgi:Rieske Fe-S protein